MLSGEFALTRKTVGEGTLFQPFVPDDKAVTIPIQDLDEIPSAVEEQEKRTGEQLVRVRDFDQPTQPFKALPHVDAPAIEEDAVNARGMQRLSPLQHRQHVGEEAGIESPGHVDHDTVAFKGKGM